MKKLLMLLALPMVANAEPLRELYMPTDAGKVVLTRNACPAVNEVGYKHQALASEWNDGQIIIHKGCWYAVEKEVFIWFYEEDPELTVFFPLNLFKAKDTQQ